MITFGRGFVWKHLLDFFWQTSSLHTIGYKDRYYLSFMTLLKWKATEFYENNLFTLFFVS